MTRLVDDDFSFALRELVPNSTLDMLLSQLALRSFLAAPLYVRRQVAEHLDAHGKPVPMDLSGITAAIAQLQRGGGCGKEPQTGGRPVIRGGRRRGRPHASDRGAQVQGDGQGPATGGPRGYSCGKVVQFGRNAKAPGARHRLARRRAKMARSRARTRMPAPCGSPRRSMLTRPSAKGASCRPRPIRRSSFAEQAVLPSTPRGKATVASKPWSTRRRESTCADFQHFEEVFTIADPGRSSGRV